MYKRQDEDFAAHKEKVHSGENEYRKRVLFLMEQSGSRPVTGQEKRIILQNFAHFQKFTRPGAKGNTVASGTFDFDAHWNPTSLSLDVSGLDDGAGTLKIENKYSSSRSFDFSC